MPLNLHKNLTAQQLVSSSVGLKAFSFLEIIYIWHKDSEKLTSFENKSLFPALVDLQLDGI